MRVAIDTNRLTDLFGGDVALSQMLGNCEEVWLPLIVLAEFKAGLLGGSKQLQNEALLARFLSKPTVRLLLPTRETAEHYSRLFIQLKAAGTPIPTNDIWIAAISIERDLVLVTRDRHFQKLPQLMKVDF